MPEHNADIEEYFKSKGYSSAEVPTVKAVTGETEYKGKFSHMWASVNFYTSLKSYLKWNKSKYEDKVNFSLGLGPTIKVHEDNKLKFYWPAEKQKEFEFNFKEEPKSKKPKRFNKVLH